MPEKMLHARTDGGLITRLPNDADNIGVWHLLGHSIMEDVLTNGHGKRALPDYETCHARPPHLNPLDETTSHSTKLPKAAAKSLVIPQAGEETIESLSELFVNAYAWVIATYCNPHSAPFVPALGLDIRSFQNLLQTRFPHFAPPLCWLAAQQRKDGKGGTLDEFSDLLQLLLDHRAEADEHHRNVAHLVATACMGGDHLWQDLGLPDRKALSALLSGHFPSLAAKNTGDMKWKKFFYKQLCEREGINACRSPSCAACCDYAKCFGAEEGDAIFQIVR
jgi:nitrogen fixation protein NifQ